MLFDHYTNGLSIKKISIKHGIYYKKAIKAIKNPTETLLK